MTLGECIQRVSGTWVIPGAADLEFGGVVVSDLMSDVLVTREESFLLVTSLTSEQVVQTADIVEASAILLSNNKQPQPAMAALARRQNLPVMVSPLSTYDICRALASLGSDS